MADRQIGNQHGFAVRGGHQQNGGSNATTAFEDDDLDNIAAMRTRLTAISSAVYTTARLNQMSVNDMKYAIRLADNPTTMN